MKFRLSFPVGPAPGADLGAGDFNGDRIVPASLGAVQAAPLLLLGEAACAGALGAMCYNADTTSHSNLTACTGAANDSNLRGIGGDR